MKTLRTGISLAALTLSVTALASPVLGQEGLGRQGTLSFGQGFEYEFGEGLQTRTDLGLNLATATRTQTFRFGLGTELFGDFTGSDEDFEFRNYSAGLGYTRRGANSSLEFSADYRESNLGDDSFEVSPGVFVLSEDGTLTSTTFGAGIEMGIEGPIGVRVDARYRDSDYEDTVDPDLFDETERSIDALATFRVAPSLSIRARAGIEEIDQQDVTEAQRESRYVGLGIGGETRGGLSFTADLIFDESEVTTNAPSTSETDGIGFEISARQERPNGSLGASLSSRTDDTGRRVTATVDREFVLKNGDLSLSLGVVDQEGVDDLQLIGDISYRAETPRGEMSASLRQTAVSDDGDTVVSTRLLLNYSREVTSYSGWEAELEYVATEELTAADDENLTSASIAYRRNLTSDWTMRTGLEYSKSDGESADKTVFFNIERDITFGF